MPFKKGEVSNPRGRAAGVANDTRRFKVNINKFLEYGSDKLLKWLDEVAEKDPKAAIDAVCKLAEFAYPRLARQVVVGEKENPVEVMMYIPKNNRDE
jgi:hypothetical protein